MYVYYILYTPNLGFEMAVPGRERERSRRKPKGEPSVPAAERMRVVKVELTTLRLRAIERLAFRACVE